MTNNHCCELNCPYPARWKIRWGPTPDDYTHACHKHVGDLLDPGKINHVWPIEQGDS